MKYTKLFSVALGKGTEGERTDRKLKVAINMQTRSSPMTEREREREA